MTTNEIAEAVQKHAVVNYEVGGWDWLVECWDRASIEEEIVRCNITTVDEAIKSFEKTVKVWDDRRRDVQAEIF